MAATVIALNGEDLGKYGFETHLFTLSGGQFHLEEFRKGIDLIFNQIGWLDNFLELTEINAF
jgi:hypothetical protein